MITLCLAARKHDSSRTPSDGTTTLLLAAERRMEREPRGKLLTLPTRTDSRIAKPTPFPSFGCFRTHDFRHTPNEASPP